MPLDHAFYTVDRTAHLLLHINARTGRHPSAHSLWPLGRRWRQGRAGPPVRLCMSQRASGSLIDLPSHLILSSSGQTELVGPRSGVSCASPARDAPLARPVDSRKTLDAQQPLPRPAEAGSRQGTGPLPLPGCCSGSDMATKAAGHGGGDKIYAKMCVASLGALRHRRRRSPPLLLVCLPSAEVCPLHLYPRSARMTRC